MEREELRRRLEAWAEEERLYAERLAESAAKARSPLVRAALTAVAMDSQKHHALLIEAARLLEGPQALGEGELEASLDDIRGHVEVEAEALRLFEGLVRDPAVQQDPQLSFILRLVLRDERFHHVVLHDLYQALARGKVLGQGEEWEELYRELDRFL
ncbi:hypothetical protein [Acidilobus sp. 7A]|uniref:hypothetical protein n=1 Tax=Acidilobus sp. 7A TaxID=1577685 RepID=UPI000764E816|nr:hypothetical protein [Acidilobus sp. 7A]AMD30148.1 hypothetical protein SE86_00435 [Acidilobus sp. 7A]